MEELTDKEKKEEDKIILISLSLVAKEKEYRFFISEFSSECW